MLKATSSSDCRDDRAFTRPQSGTLAVRHTRAPAIRIASAVNVPAGTRTRSVPTCATEGRARACGASGRSEEHTSELQSRSDLVCRLLLEKKKKNTTTTL